MQTSVKTSGETELAIGQHKTSEVGGFDGDRNAAWCDGRRGNVHNAL